MAAPPPKCWKARFFADRDNFNSSFSGDLGGFTGTNANYGGSLDFHFARSNGHTTWYGDWSAADKAAMAAILSVPGKIYTVELVVHQSATNPGTDTPSDQTAAIQAFQSSTDWVEGSGNGSADGATHLRAFDSKTNDALDIGWDGDLNKNFFQLGGVMNSVGMPGWNGALNAANRVVLDEALVTALLTDSTVRGIRAFQFQDGGQAKHQRNWSSEYAGDVTLRPQLVISSIPEPASLGLLGLGGLLFLRRRRA